MVRGGLQCMFVSVDTDTEETQSVLEYFGVTAGKVEPAQVWPRAPLFVPLPTLLSVGRSE